MKYSMILFDLDGTLLTKEYSVQQENIKLIEKLDHAGYIVGIASGRRRDEAVRFASELNISKLKHFVIIAENGQYIQYNHELIHSHIYQISTLQNLVSYEHHTNSLFFYISDKSTFITKPIDKFLELEHVKLNRKLFDYYLSLDLKMLDVNQLDCDIQTIEMYLPKDKAVKLSDMIPTYRAVHFNDVFADYMPKTASKMNAIDILSLRLNIPTSKVIAFGDGFNDIEMIHGVGLGIAMENAVEALKEVADFVTKPNDASGIKYAVTTLNLLGKGCESHDKTTPTL